MTGGPSGSGAGIVTFSVSPNAAGARTGTLTVAGRTFTVNQVSATARMGLVLDFGAPHGIWTLQSGAWQQLHGASAEIIQSGDLDGNLVDDLVIDFGTASGLWAWMNGATWVQLHGLSPTQMAIGDLDGNGRDEVVVGFPGYGIYIWRNHTTWAQVRHRSRHRRPIHGYRRRRRIYVYPLSRYTRAV